MQLSKCLDEYSTSRPDSIETSRDVIVFQFPFGTPERRAPTLSHRFQAKKRWFCQCPATASGSSRDAPDFSESWKREGRLVDGELHSGGRNGKRIAKEENHGSDCCLQQGRHGSGLGDLRMAANLLIATIARRRRNSVSLRRSLSKTNGPSQVEVHE